MLRIKDFVCILICIFYYNSYAYSQELSVKNIYLADNDLSASVNSRMDGNGSFCSLIRVQTNLSNCGMSFTGNIYGSVEEHNDEYWVYCTPGTKLIGIRCPNYLPVQVYLEDFNIKRTEPKKTYILQVLGQNSITPTAKSKMQGLTIKYSPSNAVVKINNEDMEASNGLFKTKYPIGKYTYEISAPGYVTKSEILDLSPKEPVNITITLQTLTQMQEEQLLKAEDLYKRGISLLHLGQDENAESLAVRCVELGSDKGYELITALLLHGYYDDEHTVPVSKIKLEEWQMKRFHKSGKELLENRH